MKICSALALVLFFIPVFAAGTCALTVDEIIRLKNAGVSDETIQLLIRRESEEREKHDPSRIVGRKEITLPDGRRQIIYYSISDPEEVDRRRKEEKEKVEKSWDVLKNLIVTPKEQNHKGTKTPSETTP